jgi:serine/threonine-protein kinase
VGEPAAAKDPLIGAIVDGRWRIEARLGAGGMGVVYRAAHVGLGRAVALKLLDERGAASPSAVARFEREARAISRLSDPRIVSILDFGVHGRRPYIVMELLRGRRLTEEIARGPLAPARAVAICGQILDGLRHAHGKGVVHRDLKPDNVMLVGDTPGEERVTILDFGLARIISVEEPSISLPATVAGTPSYMAPEQCAGRRVDHRADLYAAGVILYAMCVGKKPFVAADPKELFRLHREALPPSPRRAAPAQRLSEALERVILRALAKEPDARFFHAAEMRAALDATPEGRKARALAGHPRRSRRAVARGVTLALVIALVVAVVVVAVGAALGAFRFLR